MSKKQQPNVSETDLQLASLKVAMAMNEELAAVAPDIGDNMNLCISALGHAVVISVMRYAREMRRDPRREVHMFAEYLKEITDKETVDGPADPSLN